MGVLADVLERNVAAAALRTHRYAHPDVVQHGLFQVGALVTKRGQTAVTPKVMATATSTVMTTATSTAVTAVTSTPIITAMTTNGDANGHDKDNGSTNSNFNGTNNNTIGYNKGNVLSCMIYSPRGRAGPVNSAIGSTRFQRWIRTINAQILQHIS